jgi:hypothetical protein
MRIACASLQEDIKEVRSARGLATTHNKTTTWLTITVVQLRKQVRLIWMVVRQQQNVNGWAETINSWIRMSEDGVRGC